MKLSQALIIRSDYQNKIYELKKRIINNSKVQEGENVSEDPMKLLKELNRVIDELDIITKRINKTNNESLFEDNITIADAICTRAVSYTHLDKDLNIVKSYQDAIGDSDVYNVYDDSKGNILSLIHI